MEHLPSINIPQPPVSGFRNIVTTGSLSSPLDKPRGYFPEEISVGVKCGVKTRQHNVHVPQGTSENSSNDATAVKFTRTLCFIVFVNIICHLF